MSLLQPSSALARGPRGCLQRSIKTKGVLPVTVARAVGKSAGGNPAHSFDSEDDLDRSLNDELNARATPERMRRMAEHLDLVWKIRKTRSAEACSECKGAREKECDWCHGTGVMTVGDTLFCSTSTHSSKCPVCRGTGYCQCNHCRGTGFRAKWLDGSATTPK
mmetsp:Transcript_5187/g.11312  ORF Transcript_5187/g.11312 Transcript_5187/m.11312 type:complete len:163 (-) Transcript_5187:1596-2084(-)